MTPPAFETFFLPAGGNGQRFCVFHPARGPAAKGAIVYVHPFAEEMNKSRRMAARQSRAMSEAGYAVLQIDLLGCGDSSGDLGDASWQDWIDDVLLGCQWLSDRVTAPLWIWGLRVGCLLAVQAARQLPAAPHLLLWAPVISGKQGLQQFLRLKAAADLASGNAKQVLEQLRTDLAQGRPVEIAGYMLPAGIADGLERASLEPPAQADCPCRVEWLELSTRVDAVLSPMATKTLATWSAVNGVEACGHMAHGPAFWQTSEIEDAPALVATTMTALAGDMAA
ncbi:MAG: hydrolase 2, exosortase A system-associated [Rhodoferax sp.]|nr:hydrolase 2, exosortase A system-associated [Rhodoferax sp.]